MGDGVIVAFRGDANGLSFGSFIVLFYFYVVGE